jgi:biotin carboxylase
MSKEEVVVLVDAMSTAKHYADGLRRVGLQCVHVQSTDDLHPRFYREFVREKYLDNIISNETGKLDDLRDRYDVLCVLPGQDPVAPLADQLAERLGARYRNSAETSSLRVDKFDMIAGIRARELRAPVCSKVRSLSQLDDLFGSGVTYPLVIKPPRSAGVDLVEICPDADTTRRAAQAVFDSRDVYGATNDYAVVQSYIPGQEYMVDTVSFAGKTTLISVWKMTRANSRMPYPLYAVSVDPSSPEAITAFKYVCSVTEALGHTFGPAHCEVKLDADGATLIEINPRLHGSLDVHAVEHCMGESQITFLAKRLRGQHDKRLPASAKHVLKAYFLSPRTGMLQEDLDLSPFRSLASFHSIDAMLKAGRQLARTVNLATAAGYIYLSATSEAELHADYDRFRTLEARMWSSAVMGQ